MYRVIEIIVASTKLYNKIEIKQLSWSALLNK